jgi:hypothetical protein
MRAVIYSFFKGAAIMHENLIATAEALKLVNPRNWTPEPYQNRRGIWGIWVVFWNAYQFHMISVHNCPVVLRPKDALELIEGVEVIDDAHWGIYLNQKGMPGFYACARSTRVFNGSTDHWIMIGRSPERKFLWLLNQKRYWSQDEVDLIRYMDRGKRDSRLCA